MEWPHKVVLESHFSEVAQSYMKTTKFSFEGAWLDPPGKCGISRALSQCCSPCSTWTREGHQVNFIFLHGQRIDSGRAANCMCDTIRERLDRYISQSSLAWTPCLGYFPTSNFSPQTNSFWICCLFTSDHDFTSTLNISGVVTWYFCWQSKSRAAQTVRYSVPSEHSAVASLVQRILYVAAG